ncbi:MAG: VRR-NUC domain-containing protein [Sporomusaceae bacterium]|nr:VRR-NUC domain-containing protein [Sporomusaceae bacterium]
MTEHDIQNQIRIAISQNGLGVSFRTNVGSVWTGEQIIKNSDGSITIIKPRPFQTGLPEGFSDLFVVQPTPIGARPVFMEVKTAKGRIRPAQINFIKQMNNLGAKAGVVRSADDALKLLREE